MISTTTRSPPQQHSALPSDGHAAPPCATTAKPTPTYAAQALEIAKIWQRLPSEADVDDINLVPDEYRGLDRYEARKRIVDAITMRKAWP
jgi:hypothetical protein